MGLSPIEGKWDNRTASLDREDKRTTLAAFMVAEKEGDMAARESDGCPTLWNKRLELYTQSGPRTADTLLLGAAMNENQHSCRYYRVFSEEDIVVISNVTYVPDLPPLSMSKHLRKDSRYGLHKET
ncbi:hypothetical protein AURDEDRAFT_175408 [Auricularia subglabra TFB-10046 SS5]|nr:hypothetical protein AURDEDRAFT_175408 [Auricularia subglabra TFB-10046 SS5]